MTELVVTRNFRPGDVARYVQLIHGIDEVDRLGRATSLAHMEEDLGRPGYYPEEDLFFAEVDGLVVGYADIVRELEIDRIVLDGAVHPAHRGRGIGGRLLEVAFEHGRELGAKVIQIPIAERMKIGQRLVQKRGFRVVRRQWQMSLTKYRVGSLQLHHGFELRHFVPGDEESLCALQNLAFAGSWGFRPNTVDDIHYLVNCSLCHAEGIPFIAEGERLVAYCWTMDDPSDKGRGLIRMMGVDPTYRRRGLGRAVLVAGVNYLQRRAMTRIELTVDSKNTSAKRLYQSVGFTGIGRTLWYQRRL